MGRIYLLLLLLAVSADLAAQRDVLARAQLDTNRITIGDQVWLRVQVSAPPGTDITTIADGALVGGQQLEVLEKREPVTLTTEPELLIEQRWRLTTWDSGYVNIPPLEVIYRNPAGSADTTRTRPLRLTVLYPPAAADRQIEDIKPIIEEPLRWTDFWPLYLALGLALLAGLGFWLYRRRSREVPPPPPAVVVPAHERALQRLQELEQQRLWQQGRIKAYQSELTHILRRYLEEAFGVPALETTTRELDRALEKGNHLDAGQRQRLIGLLQIADMVKFARAEPTADIHERGMQDVRRFILDTRPTAPQNEPQ